MDSNKVIEKLRQENQQLKERLELKLEELHTAYCAVENVKTKNGELKEKIKQLQQGQKQLAINKMIELYNLTDEIYHSNDMDKEWLLDWLKAEIWKLNQEIKSLKGEE